MKRRRRNSGSNICFCLIVAGLALFILVFTPLRIMLAIISIALIVAGIIMISCRK